MNTALLSPVAQPVATEVVGQELAHRSNTAHVPGYCCMTARKKMPQESHGINKKKAENESPLACPMTCVRVRYQELHWGE